MVGRRRIRKPAHGRRRVETNPRSETDDRQAEGNDHQEVGRESNAARNGLAVAFSVDLGPPLRAVLQCSSQPGTNKYFISN